MMDDISKRIMEGNRLLASAALFRSLHDENMDQQDILAKFITASVHINNLNTFDSREISTLINTDFGFEIPEAVVRSCIRRKLKLEISSVPASRNRFQKTQNFSAPIELQEQLKEAQRTQDSLAQKLVTYVEGVVCKHLEPRERDILISDFYEHVKGTTKPGANAAHIGLFIIKLGEQSELDVLEKAKQGLIICEGLRYSTEGGNGANLSADLHVYLDMEILFSATGLHGQMRKEIFRDFHELAKDINRRPGKKSPGKIKFRYFDDTKLDIDKYFAAAISIVGGRERLNPNRDAMNSIIEGCRSRFDVMLKEESFWRQVEELGITPDNESNYLDNHDYNIESGNLLTELSRTLRCDEEMASFVLSKFSKINYIRKGRSSPPLESVRAIFLSGKSAVRQAGYLTELYDNSDRFIPYSTDLDFMTTWLWSKLGRAFGKNQSTPIAFSIVNKTRLVLSAQLGVRVSDEYDRLREEMADEATANGRREEISRVLAKLRCIKISPEEVGSNDADLGFLFEDDLVSRAAEEHRTLLARAELAEIEKHAHAKERAERQKLEEDYNALQIANQKVLASLQHRATIDARDTRRKSLLPKFQKVTRYEMGIRALYWAVAPTLLFLVILKIVAPSDTVLAITGTAVTVLLPLFTVLFTFRSRLDRFCFSFRRKSARAWRCDRRQELAPPDSVKGSSSLVGSSSSQQELSDQ